MRKEHQQRKKNENQDALDSKWVNSWLSYFSSA